MHSRDIWGCYVKLDADDLKDLQPLIAAAVRATVDQIQADDHRLDGGRLGYLEREAAALLGIQPHVLGDSRRRGEITARRVGKSYVYSRESLVKFLESQ